MAVYVAMTAGLWGTETQVRASSRELAAMVGLGKDSVRRAMQVMQRVGMLRAMGSHRRTVEFHLVCLKDLAMKYGGVYDRRRCSYVVTDAQRAKLLALVYDSTGAVADSEEKSTGAVADSGAGAVRAITGAVADSSGAVADSSGAPGCAASFSDEKEDEDKDNPPPTPAQRAGEMGAVLSFTGNSDARRITELQAQLAKSAKLDRKSVV